MLAAVRVKIVALLYEARVLLRKSVQSCTRPVGARATCKGARRCFEGLQGANQRPLCPKPRYKTRRLAGVLRTQVVKVLHGADSDVVWLQRDFGIFIANLFDTGQASRVLALPSHGLAHLLAHFCDVKARPFLLCTGLLNAVMTAA